MADVFNVFNILKVRGHAPSAFNLIERESQGQCSLEGKRRGNWVVTGGEDVRLFYASDSNDPLAPSMMTRRLPSSTMLGWGAMTVPVGLTVDG